MARVDRLSLAEDSHEHVVVRLLQRKVEVARHLVHQQVALDVAALAEVLPQVLDRALVLEDARQQLGEQLRQQRVGLAHQVGLEHLHRRPPVLKLLLAHAVARREEPPRRRRRRAPRRLRELLRQPAAVLIERRLRDVAHHVRHVVAAHVERVEADHRARQRGEGDVDVDLQRLAAARVDEEVLALLDGEEVGELDARQQHDQHRAHERDDRAGQRALPKLLERLRVDVEGAESYHVRAQIWRRAAVESVASESVASVHGE